MFNVNSIQFLYVYTLVNYNIKLGVHTYYVKCECFNVIKEKQREKLGVNLNRAN